MRHWRRLPYFTNGTMTARRARFDTMAREWGEIGNVLEAAKMYGILEILQRNFMRAQGSKRRPN
jgi:hypothetical protein